MTKLKKQSLYYHNPTKFTKRKSVDLKMKRERGRCERLLGGQLMEEKHKRVPSNSDGL